MPIDAGAAARLLADRFVRWQSPYGRPDPRTCPFVTPVPAISTHFHSPTFMAIGLYAAWDAYAEPTWKEAADRYVMFYLAAMRDPPVGGQRQDYPSFPYQYGMALAGFGAFRSHNPEERLLDGKASALYEWLAQWRWAEGSYFRNGYGNEKHGVVDCANSDDNCHMGRGLMAYHAVQPRGDVLHDAVGLAGYYVRDVVPGTFGGCWSDALGTWVVAPTTVDSFEHFRNSRSCDMGWGFTSVGVIEFLTRLAPLADPTLAGKIESRCVRSMRWQFDECQFDDGACGMRGRDDRWFGMTAGAILSYLRVRDAGFLDAETDRVYLAKARLARRWLLENISEETIDSGGYFRVTGTSEPRPPENQAWQLGWTLEALVRSSEF